jgi:hypothetical protein
MFISNLSRLSCFCTSWYALNSFIVYRKQKRSLDTRPQQNDEIRDISSKTLLKLADIRCLRNVLFFRYELHQCFQALIDHDLRLPDLLVRDFCQRCYSLLSHGRQFDEAVCADLINGGFSFGKLNYLVILILGCAFERILPIS